MDTLDHRLHILTNDIDTQASWLSDYNGGIYNDDRKVHKNQLLWINSMTDITDEQSFRCCEQATDSQCKYNLNHEVF